MHRSAFVPHLVINQIRIQQTATNIKSPEKVRLDKKYFFMRNFNDIHGHPGLLTANVGQHVALITMMKDEINVELIQDKRPILDAVGTTHNIKDESGNVR